MKPDSEDGVVLRMVAAFVVAAALAGSLGSCANLNRHEDGCVGDEPVAMPVAAHASDSVTGGQPAGVVEALWTVDPSGMLRAFDGMTDDVLTSVDIWSSVFAPGLRELKRN
jgi:hypothetical protein